MNNNLARTTIEVESSYIAQNQNLQESDPIRCLHSSAMTWNQVIKYIIKHFVTWRDICNNQSQRVVSSKSNFRLINQCNPAFNILPYSTINFRIPGSFDGMTLWQNSEAYINSRFNTTLRFSHHINCSRLLKQLSFHCSLSFSFRSYDLQNNKIIHMFS